MEMNQMRAVARLMDVKRWNMVRVSREQSVLEHSAMVGTIAARIVSVIRKINPNSPLYPAEAMYHGMLHDADEAITGDIPSHVKRAVRIAGLDIDDLSGFERVPTMYKSVVKAADRIEGFLWLQEYRQGSHAQWVFSDIENSLKSFINSLEESARSACWQVFAELNRDVRPDFDLRFEEFEQVTV